MNPPSTPAQPARLPAPVGHQADVIYLDANRDQVVLGTAGSGKTLMAVYRAAHLSDPAQPHGGRTLLVTYNKALTGYLEHLVGPGHDQLDVRNYHRVTRGYLSDRGQLGNGEVADGWIRRAYMSAAIADARTQYRADATFFNRSMEFFLDELDWLSSRGYTTKDAYLAAARVGRVVPLSPATRGAMWKIRKQYLQRRAAGGHRYDWWDMPTAVIAELATDLRERTYKHIVVDEAQDLPPEALRSLVALKQPGGTITLFADYAQQLYGQRTSWADAGLNIRQPEVFRENYRNSPGIARLAIATAALPHFTDSVDLVAPRGPAAAGVPPTLFRAANVVEERRIVADRARELSATGTVAVLAQTHASAARYIGNQPYRTLKENALSWSDAPGIYVGTYYSAKGLEFDAVILPGLNASWLPDQESIDAFGLDEARERFARLLYVGVTRARSELLGTYTDQFTELLPHPDSGHWLVAGARR